MRCLFSLVKVFVNALLSKGGNTHIDQAAGIVFSR